jgi:hypothetical protein
MVNNDAFLGTAATELYQECDITPKPAELVHLNELIYDPETIDWCGMGPSVGGTAELIHMYLWKRSITRAALNALHHKTTHWVGGVTAENEIICLKFVEIKNVVKETADAKALSALAMCAWLADNTASPLNEDRTKRNDSTQANATPTPGFGWYHAAMGGNADTDPVTAATPAASQGGAAVNGSSAMNTTTNYESDATGYTSSCYSDEE